MASIYPCTWDFDDGALIGTIGIAKLNWLYLILFQLINKTTQWRVVLLINCVGVNYENSLTEEVFMRFRDLDLFALVYDSSRNDIYDLPLSEALKHNTLNFRESTDSFLTILAITDNLKEMDYLLDMYGYMLKNNRATSC